MSTEKVVRFKDFNFEDYESLDEKTKTFVWKIEKPEDLMSRISIWLGNFNSQVLNIESLRSGDIGRIPMKDGTTGFRVFYTYITLPEED